MTIAFQEERFADVIGEVEPLLHEHWGELARNKDVVPLNIDHVSYAKLDRRDHLLIVTVREDRRLIGYAVYVIFPNGHPHYMGSPWAESDIFFLVPEARNGMIALGLFREMEDRLRKRGVVVMNTRWKLEHPAAGRLLEHLGHVPIETVCSKILKSH